MRTNPLVDSLRYMFTMLTWTTVTFDVLLLAGILLAILVYRRYPAQRTTNHLWTWLARTVMGAMWWQQVIWKVPPNYGGLHFWTSEMAKFASTDIQRAFVSNVVLAHFPLFAPQVFLVEALISVTLLLGVWSRFGSLLGAAMALNLSQGLYRSPGEWPWQYVFLIIVMVQFVLFPPGRSLGLDVLVMQHDGANRGALSRLLRRLR